MFGLDYVLEITSMDSSVSERERETLSEGRAEVKGSHHRVAVAGVAKLSPGRDKKREREEGGKMGLNVCMCVCACA